MQPREIAAHATLRAATLARICRDERLDLPEIGRSTDPDWATIEDR
jgi:hypothetical protein